MFELRTLGGLELRRVGDGGMSAISMQAKRLALLAYLASLPANSFRRRDTLLLLFWPELDQEHARGALRQALHFLRKTLGDEAILARGEDEIGLESTVVRSDAQLLELAIGKGDAESALGLYRGDFLEGVFVTDAAPDLEDWISGERARLRGLAAKAAWMASERPGNRDRLGDLVRSAVQWSGDDEGALRRGVKLLDGMGDRAGAAALYEDFARRVARDFDVDLSPETKALLRALRARRTSDQHVSPAAAPSGLEGAPPHHAPAVAAPVSRPGRRVVLAGVAGALLVLVLAAYIGPRRSAPSISNDLVAVMPFRMPADSSLAWLGDGIVDLLTIQLGGVGGPRVVDPATVLAQWHRRSSTSDAPHSVGAEIAQRLGAGSLVEGSITGTRDHLTLSASLTAITGRLPARRAVVEGPADSIPQMVDRLAAQLLGMSAGMEGAQLASLTTASLPAVRLFVEGQKAFRRGRMETAVERFTEAIGVDSTFALAGLWLVRASVWAGTGDAELGLRTAMAGRTQLSVADQALLDASAAEWATASEMFARLNGAVSAYPSRPETWYTLGDAHYHDGALAGEPDWAERAEEAFRRGWVLDSAAGVGLLGDAPIAEPIMHFVELAHMRHDTAEVLRLASSVLAVDSTSELARTVMWHRALVTSDSAREYFWKHIGIANQRVTMNIVLFMAWTGVGTVDQPRARAEDERRLRAHDPGYTNVAITIQALNDGRPSDVVWDPPARGTENRVHRSTIRAALSWDGDTSAAIRSARVLAQSVAKPATGEAAREQLFDACTLGEWQAARGEFEAADRALAHLRAARVASGAADAVATQRYIALCAALLEAMQASGLRQPGARNKVATADSLAQELFEAICCGERVSDANIQIARLWEREGDLNRALAAIMRRSAQFRIAPVYMSTFTREEGRLAAMTGDTARAISAWKRYLAFRHDPQPSLKPAVDSIRMQLAALEKASH